MLRAHNLPRWFLVVALFCEWGVAAYADEPAMPTEVYGFGAGTLGGAGGRELRVISLADDVDPPQSGTLRWAVEQEGPRIVRFDVAGNIRLRKPLEIRNSNITIDGSDAPGLGVCLCDHSLVIKKTHDVVVRYLRIRRGDVTVLARNKAEGLKRPKNSGDLDCISADDSANLVFDHLSVSWCTDELFGIVRCKNVTIQWCILSEPLTNPALHPYGDNHAFGLNTSASALTIHHCLLAHYVMRGPQFEANDVKPGLGFDPQFEAVNNVLFDYERSGSRYTTGIENDPEEAAGVKFAFHFVNNTYFTGKDRPEIFAELKHGVTDAARVFVSGNIGPHRRTLDEDEWDVLFAGDKPMRQGAPNVQAQVAQTPLFTSTRPVPQETADLSRERVLQEAGCSHRRDSVDERVVEDTRLQRFGRIIRSQADIGSWPALK